MIWQNAGMVQGQKKSWKINFQPLLRQFCSQIFRAVSSQVSAHAFPTNFAGFFVKNSCRTARLSAPPRRAARQCRATLYACEFSPEIRPDYARKYIDMTYDDSA